MRVILFDVDGTITDSGQIISKEMSDMIKKLANIPNTVLGIVGGGTYQKIKWQLDTSIQYFKYVFAECGAVIYINGNLISEKSLLDYCDRKELNLIIKKALKTISKMPIIYHGNQIDFRKGLIYISPPGMQSTSYERSYFLEKDQKYKLRELLLKKLQSLNKKGLFEIVYGGAVGIAIYLKGWDKGQVVEYFKDVDQDNELYYIGDKCEVGGNDYPIYSHPLVNGYSVKDYHSTIEIINNFLKNWE